MVWGEVKTGRRGMMRGGEDGSRDGDSEYEVQLHPDVIDHRFSPPVVDLCLEGETNFHLRLHLRSPLSSSVVDFRGLSS